MRSASRKRDTMLYAAIVATNSTTPCASNRRAIGSYTASATWTSRVIASAKARDGALFIAERIADIFLFHRTDLFVGDACARARAGTMRVELERRAIQHRDTKYHELAHIGRQRAAVANRGEQLLPALGERRAVEERLVERGVMWPRSGQDRALDAREVRARSRCDWRNAGPTVFTGPHAQALAAALPPEGAIRTLGRPDGAHWTPTLAALAAALP